MAKLVFIYLACTAALMVAVFLICGGGWYSMAGLLWAAVLYVSGDVFPDMWKTYWTSNIKILAYFNCL